MAARRPLVLINGRQTILPAGDTVDGVDGGGGGGALVNVDGGAPSSIHSAAPAVDGGTP